MSPEVLRAKLLRLCAIEGYASETELFEAAVADSACSRHLLQPR